MSIKTQEDVWPVTDLVRIAACNGPGCDVSAVLRFEDRTVLGPGWLAVKPIMDGTEPGLDGLLHFHSRECLGRWLERRLPGSKFIPAPKKAKGDD